MSKERGIRDNPNNLDINHSFAALPLSPVREICFMWTFFSTDLRVTNNISIKLTGDALKGGGEAGCCCPPVCLALQIQGYLKASICQVKL